MFVIYILSIKNVTVNLLLKKNTSLTINYMNQDEKNIFDIANENG